MSCLPFMGEDFEIAERIGLMPLLQFATLAKAGVDSASMEGLAAMHALLQQCLSDEDWQRFQDHATATRASEDDLLAFIQQVIEVLSARPTQRPSDSSDGPLRTEPSSTDDSSSRVIRRLEQQGRPDLAHQVLVMQEYRAG